MMDTKETKNQKQFWKLFNKLDKKTHNKINVSPEALTKHIRTTRTSKRNVNIPRDGNDKEKLD